MYIFLITVLFVFFCATASEYMDYTLEPLIIFGFFWFGYPLLLKTSIKAQKIITLVLLILLLLAHLLSSSLFDYARITDVDYKAIVVDEENSRGKVLITEKLTFDIHAFSRNNGFWELWRELPENEVDGVKVKYKVNSVKQILNDGTEIIYEESPKLYWSDYDYVDTNRELGPGKYFHSQGPYNEDAGNYECLMFYIDNVYRDKMTFEIEYEMTNATLRYNDCSELYLSFYSGQTINYLNSFKAQVLIPNKDMPQRGNYISHTYGTTSNTFPYKESDTLNPGYHTFLIELDKSDLKFRPYNEYLELAVVSFGDDKRIFAENASTNMYTSKNVLDNIYEEMDEYDLTPSRYVFPKFCIFLVCSAGACLVIWCIQKLNKNIRRKYFLKPEVDYTYFRDIPSDLDPYFASRLAFCKTKPNKKIEDEYAAILLSLVRKKYIALTKENSAKDYTPANTRILITYSTPSNDLINAETSNDLEPLTLTEKYYFNLLKKHSYVHSADANTLESWYGTTLSYFEKRVQNNPSSTSQFVNEVIGAEEKIGIRDGYFKSTNPKKLQTKYRRISYAIGIFGILLMIFCNNASCQTRYDFAFGAYTVLGLGFIYSAYYLYKNSKDYVLLSQFGENEYAKWHGLYNFLNSDTLMNERTVIELPIWEKYLVYATAFGISEKVTSALKVRYPEYLLDTTTSITGNSFYTSNSFRNYTRSFTQKTRNAYTSYATRSSGYRSYGGYQVGSSYSGSYGGHSRIRWWRPWRRRWPEEVTKHLI